MESRVYNFSPGPSVLPDEVLLEAKENLTNFKNSGLGIMEMSHRGKAFEDILNKAIEDLRSILSIPSNYDVLFTTGGATQQFSMVPLNLIEKDQIGCYLISGGWAQKAFKEAKKLSQAQSCGSSESSGFRNLPKLETLPDNTAYLHFTSNNTLYGTEFFQEPESRDFPLVCDASSDICSHTLDITKYGLIYAGAQKNLGPSGITLVIINKDLLQRSAETKLPSLLNYNTYSKSNSLENTIPTFPVYIVSLVLKWIIKQGGLEKIAKNNQEKAKIIYDELDSNSFFKPYADKDARSLMNVTFTLKDESLDTEFLKKAEANGLNGLKGHRSVGGFRASIYNAFPLKGVQTLVEFMRDFSKSKG